MINYGKIIGPSLRRFFAFSLLKPSLTYRDACQNSYVYALQLVMVFACGLSVSGGTIGILPFYVSFVSLAIFFALHEHSASTDRLAIGLMFSIAFYALGTYVLVSAGGDVFILLWLMAFTSLAIFQTIVLRSISVIIAWTALPFCIVASIMWTLFETIRFALTKMIDGNGLAILDLGAMCADARIFHPFLIFGGQAAATGIVVLVAAWIASIFCSNRQYGQPIAVLFLAIIISVSQWVRLPEQNTDGQSAIILVNQSIDERGGAGIMSDIKSVIAKLPNAPTWVIFSETAVELPIANALSESNAAHFESIETALHAKIDLSQCFGSNIAIGAWVGNSSQGWLNCYLLIRNGRMETMVSKQHLVPILEVGNEYSDLVILRDKISRELRHDNVKFSNGIPDSERKIWSCDAIPGICNDIFYSRSYRGFPVKPTSFLLCGMNEVADKEGLLQKISAHHAKLRAIEYQLPMVHVSHGGLSGVIDQHGFWVCRPASDIGIHAFALPQSSNSSQNIFVQKCCDAFGWILRGD